MNNVNYVNANTQYKILKEFRFANTFDSHMTNVHILLCFFFIFQDHLFTSKHIENIRSILSKQLPNLPTATTKDENLKKNSSELKFDFEPNSTSAVLDKSSKDQENQLMSYLNLMQMMPIGEFYHSLTLSSFVLR